MLIDGFSVGGLFQIAQRTACIHSYACALKWCHPLVHDHETVILLAVGCGVGQHKPGNDEFEIEDRKRSPFFSLRFI